MRASTVVTILSLIAWVALSVALPLPASKYASIFVASAMLKFYPSVQT